MRRIIYIASLAICMNAAVSCVEGFEEPAGGTVRKTFTGYQDNGIETRTSIDAEGSIIWNSNDKITVFSGTGTGNTFSDVTVSNDGKTATFAGSSAWAAEYYALYPAQSDATLSSDGVITATLPTSQTALLNTFGDGMNLAVSVSNADNLYFRNVGALLGITLPTSWGGYLKIESLNPDVKMSGKAEIRMKDGIPTAVPTSEAVNYVEFKSLSGLKAGNVMYFVVYPGNYDAGFKITVHNSGKTCKYVMATSKGLDLKRNQSILLFPPVNFMWNTAWEPYGITPTQTSETSVTLTWKCSSADDQTAGYNIYLRDGDSAGNGTLAKTISGKANTSCELAGLTPGESYDFGVQTEGGSFKDSEIVWYEDFLVSEDFRIGAEVSVNNVTSKYAYIAVDYSIDGLTESNPEKGLWISTTGTEVGAAGSDGVKLKGPDFLSGNSVKQLIPASRLNPDMKYFMRAYVWDGLQEKYVYSEPQEIQLAAQPDPITLSWEKQEYSSLSSSVSIYKTTSQMNGRNFNAWYAIADPKEVDFRVMYPETVGTKKTIKDQAEAAGDCHVLINGAIFGNYNIGAIITEGSMTQQWEGSIEGCYWATDSKLYQVTRAIIGVDSNGNPDAYWVGVPAQNQFYYYTSPMTSVVGQARYGKATSTFPYPAESWNPYYAISCGPMLVYDDKIMVDHSNDGSGHYYTNYECWSETGVYYGNPDRTAVGITEDGKIVLFICDGRIDASKGAYLTELAKLMKGIGCKYAMNLDGGGSTGMWVNGAGMINHLDDSSWRSVKSTCGFFEKK